MRPISPISGERPVDFDESTKVIPDTTEQKKPAPIGIAAHNDKMISQTPQEIRKEDFSLNPNATALSKQDQILETLQNEAQEVLNEFIRVNEENNFDDGFNFEETMVLYYKAMVALIHDDSETLYSTMKQIENEQKKIGEKRSKEYQKIIDRMGRDKWFHGINVAGTVVTGVAGVIALNVASAGTATIVAAIAGTAILALMGTEKALGNPVKNFVSDYMSKDTINGAEAALAVTGTLLHALTLVNKIVNIFGYIGLIANGIAQTGITVTNVQNKYSEKAMEELKNKSQLKSDDLEKIGKFMEFVSKELTKHIRNCRQLMKQPKIFNN